MSDVLGETRLRLRQALSVSTAELFSDAITLNPGESAHVQVEADFPTTPTDDLEVRLYGTLDDTSENWDDTPIQYSRHPGQGHGSQRLFLHFERFLQGASRVQEVRHHEHHRRQRLDPKGRSEPVT